MLPEFQYSVSCLKGIGEKREAILKDVGIETAADLLLFLPYRYVDRRTETGIGELPIDQEVTVVGEIVSMGIVSGHRSRFVVRVKDGSGHLDCVWFAGYSHLAHIISKGDLVALGGKVSSRQPAQMFHPELEILSDEQEGDRVHTGRIIPLYTTSARMKAEKLSSRGLRRLIHGVLEAVSAEIEDPLSQGMCDRCGLLPLGKAIQSIHFPETLAEVELGRKRLAFDELFYLQFQLASIQMTSVAQPGRILEIPGSMVEALISGLPFQLTGAQNRALKEIWNDLNGQNRMHRLLQGDVGSGKTIVALLSMLSVVGSGAQTVLMTPTEILAKQHTKTLQNMVRPLGLSVHLLTGHLKRAEREDLLVALKSGDAKIVVGTHALLQDDVVFSDLGLAVVDEQHRFGVLQRVALRKKGRDVNLLVMTATPIPRSLALTLYGDLDMTVLDELPPGRKRVKTGWRVSEDRDQVLGFLKDEVRQGRQAYIIYPMIDQSKKINLQPATEAFSSLQSGQLSGLRLGLLHGRMGSEEKEAIMSAFRAGKVDVLVSTTVVEVGVDVPNATVILIEHAERFGLSQLHQLRGRIGRGGHMSYCILITESSSQLTLEAQARLDALVRTTNGFEIAELDLQIRGSGHIFGTRQAGFPGFRFSDLGRDKELVMDARREVRFIIESDPNLEREENRELRNKIDVINVLEMCLRETG